MSSSQPGWGCAPHPPPAALPGHSTLRAQGTRVQPHLLLAGGSSRTRQPLWHSSLSSVHLLRHVAEGSSIPQTGITHLPGLSPGDRALHDTVPDLFVFFLCLSQPQEPFGMAGVPSRGLCSLALGAQGILGLLFPASFPHLLGEHLEEQHLAGAHSKPESQWVFGIVFP